MTKVILLAIFSLLAITGFSQSTEQQFPTPVSINEVSGAINPREIGDSRTTTYFYTFNGGQGDLFLNILSTNLNADIDLFIEQGLRPLTKIAVYADRGETETGRVIYLRKPERLLLRVQGRSPNDDPGRFRFKFAGSFVAAASDSPLPPDLPKVPAELMAESRAEPLERKPADEVAAKSDDDTRTDKNVTDETETESGEPKKKPRVVVTDPVRGETERDAGDTRSRKPSDPMASFSLIVVFRDGSRIERPMTDVARFGVDKGTLTIVPKAGQTGRYSMADVISVTVQ